MYEPHTPPARGPHPRSILVRDCQSGETVELDARLACVPHGPKYESRAVDGVVSPDDIDRRDIVELADVPGGSVWIDDETGRAWRRFEVVSE